MAKKWISGLDFVEEIWCELAHEGSVTESRDFLRKKEVLWLRYKGGNM